jgi:hypothetical protein
MSVKAMSLVGLDVHARQTHAAVFSPDTGEIAVSKLQMEPVKVVSFLEASDLRCAPSMRPVRPGSAWPGQLGSVGSMCG